MSCPSNCPFRGEANKLADMLCAVCANLEIHDKKNLLPGDVWDWWEHRKRNIAEERQKLRESARTKLTESERRAVGLE